jgi:hypothetical protein
VSQCSRCGDEGCYGECELIGELGTERLSEFARAGAPLTHYYKDSRPLCDQDGTDTSPFTGSLNVDLVTCLDCLRLLARRGNAWEGVVRAAETAAVQCRNGGPLYMLAVLRNLQHVPNKWRFADGLGDGDECEADSWEEDT